MSTTWTNETAELPVSDFPSGVSLDKFTQEITADETITTAVNYMNNDSGTVSVVFVSEPATEEKTQFDVLVAAHDGQPPAPTTGNMVEHLLNEKPGANHDSSADFYVGNRAINQITKREYVCVQDTIGNAIWTETTNILADGPSIMKAGKVLGNQFSGTIQKCIVTFTTPMANADYIINTIPEVQNDAAYVLTVESITAGSFTISANVGSVDNLIAVHWQVMLPSDQ